MKRSLFCILLAVVLFLSGCGKQATLQVYEYAGANDDNTIFDYTGEVYEEAEVLVKDTPEEKRTFVFQGTEYELNYEETEQRQFFSYAEHFYTDAANAGVAMAFRDDTNQLTKVTSQAGIKLASATVPVTEADFRAAADMLLKDYLKPEEYTCTCVTEVSHFTEDGEIGSRWYETKECFYDEAVEGETKQYVFTYTKYLDGFRTSDAAEVTFYADGTLSSMQLLNIGAFDVVKEVGVSEKGFETAIEEKLLQICKDGYQIEDFRQESILGIESSGKLFFVVSARPTVSAVAARTVSGEVSEETCIFIVTVE